MIRIIIPAYNEKNNIKKCIEGIAASIGNISYKVYVVNDGSRDGMRFVLDELAKRFPIEIITHDVNLGVSFAFKSGLDRVLSQGKRKDLVVIMEGDGTSDSKLLKVMADKLMNGSDLVIASRYQKGGAYRRFPFKRLIISKAANLSLKALFPYSGIYDYTIFYRGYRYEVLKKALEKYKEKLFISKYFAANVELLVKIMPDVKQVEEIPFIYDYGLKKGRSGLNIKKNLWQYLRFLVSTKFHIHL